MKCIHDAMLVMAIIVLIVGMLSCASEPTPTPTPSIPTLVELRTNSSVTAAELISAYDANEYAADQAFKGKGVVVTGVVGEISVGVFGPTISMGCEFNRFAGHICYDAVSATLEDGYEDFAGTVQIGQEIEMVCVVRGSTLGLGVDATCVPASEWEKFRTSN